MIKFGFIILVFDIIEFVIIEWNVSIMGVGVVDGYYVCVNLMCYGYGLVDVGGINVVN